MSAVATHPLLQYLRRLGAEPPGTLAADPQLLGRFLERRDTDAFDALLRRHGPMVWGTVRRVLRDAHDAEDAFQATFLVLARNAATIRKRASLASWLHGVARRLAVRVRQARLAAARRAADRPPPPPAGGPAEVLTWREALAVLDEELHGLPERFRAPLVLFHLEGQTQQEAARHLGWAVGTLRRRLEQGRQRLRQRLARRGVSLAGGLGGVWLAETASADAVPAALRSAAAAAAQRLAAGAPVPASVAALIEGSQPTVLKSSCKLLVTLVGVAACLGLGAAAQRAAEREPPTAPAPPVIRVAEREPDSDGDGLSDFQEVHKYRTDPRKRNTAGGAAPDGDWEARRQHTYSVRAVLRVMAPYNKAALNDDYQDARVLAEKDGYADVEFVIYPFNTNAEAVRGNPTWKRDYAGMKEYLAPGVTTNWDEAMRRELLRELARAGIDPDKLTDKELVDKVSTWVVRSFKYRGAFCTHYVHFPDGKPAVLPGLEKAFERDKGDKGWSVREQFEHELLGKEMFRRRTYGSCTSAAVLEATVLRALGIPTRIVLAVPVLDASDPAQVEMAEKGLKHHEVRHTVFESALRHGDSYAAHTFLEVYVGHRWRRLNYRTLGQNVLDRNYLGLMAHVHTFRDLSEANLAATWGKRYALSLRDDNFPRSNPYRLLEISDHFGAHAKVPNPPPKEHKELTISRVYRQLAASKEIQEALLRARPVPPGDNELMIHCDEWFPGLDHLQYKVFMYRADPELVFRAKGRADVKAQVQMGFFTSFPSGIREIMVLIPSAEYAKMAKGVPYTLHPVNGRPGYKWKVKEGLTFTRE
jgi:RNA polymerase sigma factor (sigma-70 family)